MPANNEPLSLLQGLKTDDYTITTLDDEIRVDQLCVDLLRRFNQHMTQQARLNPEQAGEICHGADYFLREFIIADRHNNLFRIDPERVRQFAGHWYIIRTPEPNMIELDTILKGTAEFYDYLANQGLVDQQNAADIKAHCLEHDYYQQRIDDFWAITGEGYNAWRQACPLEPVPDIS